MYEKFYFIILVHVHQVKIIENAWNSKFLYFILFQLRFILIQAMIMFIR